MVLSYAQNLEDVMLWRALNDVQDGLYIDIGAQDPLEDSVSLLFYQQGWRGIHVEATPQYAEKLRLARPDEVVIQAAVSSQVGVIRFYEIPNTGISTGSESIASRHKDKGYDAVPCTVPAISLDAVLGLVADRQVHWLKIDVEGMEGDVLRSWVESPVMPWIVVVESTEPMTQTPSHAEWEGLLTTKGYEFAYFDGLNRYYVSPDHLDLTRHFTNGPNIFDNFSLTGLTSSGFSQYLNDRNRLTKESLEGEISGLRRQIEAQAEETANLQEACAVLRQSELDSVRQNAHLLRQIGDLQEAAASLQAEWRLSSSADALSAERKIQEVSSKLEQQWIERDRLKTEFYVEIRQLTDQYQDSSRRLDALAFEKSTLVSEVSKLHGEINSQQSARRDLVRQIDELRSAEKRIELLERSWAWPLFSLASGLKSYSETGRSSGISPVPAFSGDRIELGIRAQQEIPLEDKTVIFPVGPVGGISASPVSAGAHVISSVGDLLVKYDSEFVSTAFITLLQRPPDEAGFLHYLQRVRSGENKAEILWQISQSPEGRDRAVKLPGLISHRPVWRRMGAKLRRYVHKLTGQIEASRQARALENLVGGELGRLANLMSSFSEQNLTLKRSLDLIHTRLDGLASEETPLHGSVDGPMRVPLANVEIVNPLRKSPITRLSGPRPEALVKADEIFAHMKL